MITVNLTKVNSKCDTTLLRAGGGGGGGGTPIYQLVYAAVKGMVFKQFCLGQGIESFSQEWGIICRETDQWYEELKN